MILLFISLLILISLVHIGPKKRKRTRGKKRIVFLFNTSHRKRRQRKQRKHRGHGEQYEYRKHLPALWVRDAGICQLCGIPIKRELYKWPHPLSLSIDHVFPVSRGGTHDIDNLQIAHLDCNMRKSAKIVKRIRMR